jgi:hypothetical protein
MTPKEKANELVQKMRVHSPVWEIEGDAKQCALIAVDECLHTCVESMMYYWKEVKQEIEKL